MRHLKGEAITGQEFKFSLRLYTTNQYLTKDAKLVRPREPFGRPDSTIPAILLQLSNHREVFVQRVFKGSTTSKHKRSYFVLAISKTISSMYILTVMVTPRTGDLGRTRVHKQPTTH